MVKMYMLCLLLVSTLFADKEVKKTATLNIYVHEKKSLAEIKDMAIKQAKLDALSEIFGDFVKSEAIVSNGTLLDSLVEEKSKNGVIHLKGEPIYKNGKNFGDIQVEITAYATDLDIQRFSPQTIELKGFKYSNKNAAIKELKGLAENAFILAALSNINPAMKNFNGKHPKDLTTSLNTNINEKEAFDDKTLTYTIDGTVGYIPFAIEQIN